MHQVKETLQGDLDARILERLVKIMAYMSAASGAAAVKKKVKKKQHLQGIVLPGGVALAGSLRPDRDAAALKDGAGPDAEGAGQPGVSAIWKSHSLFATRNGAVPGGMQARVILLKLSALLLHGSQCWPFGSLINA